MIQPGKTIIQISDTSLIDWGNSKAVRFSATLGIGDRGGDLYCTFVGCIAWRNFRREIEWSVPRNRMGNTRIDVYSGFVSPRYYEEVRRFIEEKFGHRLEWVGRRKKKKEILELNEGEEIIEFDTGRARSDGLGETRGDSEDQQSKEGTESEEDITREWESPGGN